MTAWRFMAGFMFIRAVLNRAPGIAASALSACLSACSGGGASLPAQGPQAAHGAPQTDLEIAQQLYADSARTPPGFYSEPAPAAGYTTTFHIRNSDIAVATAVGPVHELCTSDWNEAFDWSEIVAASQAVPTDLTATESKEQYFEFVRTARASALSTEQIRVYRCEFLDRDGADLSRLTGAAGHINKRPLTEADVRWTLEYLWHFSAYDNVDNAVLKSAATGTSASPAHELTLAKLTRGGGAGGCDRIRVFVWSYRADPVSGELVSEQRDLWNIDARNESGVARLCGS